MTQFKQFLNEESDKQKAYQEFFDKLLKKYGVESPEDLSDEDKKKFFDEVDAGWKGEDEEKETNESAVGTPGRTSINDAKAHISDDLIKEFNAIVKKLGGKTVARTILGGFKPEKKAEKPSDLDTDGGVPASTIA